MADQQKAKSTEYSKKNSDDYVTHTSKGGNKGFVKRDHGPARHHVPYGRHKADEGLLDKELLEEIIDEIHDEQAESL